MNTKNTDTSAREFVERAIRKYSSWDFENMHKPEGSLSPNLSDQSTGGLLEGGGVALHPEAELGLPELPEHTSPASGSVPQAQMSHFDSLVPQKDIPTLDLSAIDEGAQTFESDLQGGPHFTDGPARIIGAHDGSKKCFALLLTEDMVANLRQITEAARELDLIGPSFEDAKGQATMAEVCKEQIQDSLEATDNQDEANQFRAEMDEMESKLLKAREKMDTLELDVMNLKLSLESSRSISHELFEGVLKEANLLVAREPENQDLAPNPERLLSRRNSAVSIQSSESLISSDELNRRATAEELALETKTLRQYYTAFRNRDRNYAKQLQEWDMDVQEGRSLLTRSEFDRYYLRDAQQLTRNLIETEAAQDSAAIRARELGILQNSSEQGSKFVDDVDDGYSLSLEIELKASVDRGYIDQWMNAASETQDSQILSSSTEDDGTRIVERGGQSIGGVSESQDSQILSSESEEDERWDIEWDEQSMTGVSESQDSQVPSESEEDERWDAKWDGWSVGMCDSFSVIDPTRNRRHIDRWQESCAVQREEDEQLRNQTMAVYCRM